MQSVNTISSNGLNLGSAQKLEVRLEKKDCNPPLVYTYIVQKSLHTIAIREAFLYILISWTYIEIIFYTIQGPSIENLYSSLFTLVCCVHDSCPLHCMVDQDGCWRSIDPNLSSLFWLNMYVICICFVVGIGIREGHRLISCK